MKMTSWFTLAVFTLLPLLCPPAVASGREYMVRGRTMGTFYTVKFISSKPHSLDLWQAKIDMQLKAVNKHLSMYDPESELSRFNRFEAGKPFKVSPDFRTVLQTAGRIHTLTRGAWDGTVKPLVDLWGFGTKDQSPGLPEKKAIADTLALTGFRHLEFNGSGLLKKIPGITLDLGSIAKGYGVDAVAALLKDSGLDNFLVEIGGELKGEGVNKKGRAWSVGISRPEKKAALQGLMKIISLENQAIATSGNYRNFFEIKGKTYSHIIDPKTGWPVGNRVVSASVLADDCTFADGLATALMVMDVADGLDLVNRLEGVECLIVQKTAKGLAESYSTNFKASLK